MESNREAVVPAIGIAKLLEDYRTETGASYGDIMKRTGIRRGYVGFLVTNRAPIKIQPETIKRLADGLSIPMDVVRQAAMVSAGYADLVDQPEVPDRACLIGREVSELTEDQIEIVAAVIAIMRAQNEAA